MAIVYRHRRLDTLQPFYIGIGKSKSRAYRTDNRTGWWKKVVKKAEYSVEILAENISYENAQELECFLISEYGRLDNKTGILINQTNGGEGTLGRIVSEETKRKIGLANTSIVFKKRKPLSEETKLKIGLANKGFKHSKETIEKNRLRGFGKKQSLEAIEKRRLALKGNKNGEGNKGKNQKGRQVLDINTGIIYKSITLACLDLNLHISTVWRNLQKDNFKLKYI